MSMGNVPAFRHTTTSNCYKDGIIVYCLAINKKYISKSTYTVNVDSRYTPSMRKDPWFQITTIGNQHLTNNTRQLLEKTFFHGRLCF